jgi:hypothetical protein
MTEREWLTIRFPDHLFRSRIAHNHRKRRLVGCGCARHVLPQLQDDPRAVALIEASEQYADSGPDGSACWKAIVAAREGVRALIREAEQAGRAELSQLWAAYAVYSVSNAAGLKVGSVFRCVDSATDAAWKLMAPAPRSCDHLALIHDVFGNPFRPVTFSPSWRTDTAVSLARQMYETRDFSPMPILADALQDAGCEDVGVLGHCRAPGGPHVRGCWVVDLLLGKA